MGDNSFLSSLSVLNLSSILIDIAFWCVPLLVLQSVLKNQILPKIFNSEINGEKFPSCKTYDILQTAFSFWKKGWIWEHLHAEYLQIVTGFAALYPEEDVIDISIGFTHIVLLTKAKPVEELLMGKNLTKRLGLELLAPWLGNSFVLSTSPEWKQRKKLVMPLFRNSTMETLLAKMDERCKNFVNSLKHKLNEDWIDIRNIMEHLFMELICDALFGINSAEVANDSEYIRAMSRITRTVMKRMFNPFLYSDFIFQNSSVGGQFRKDISYTRGLIQKVVQQRKAAETLQKRREDLSETKYEDLVNILLDAHAQNPDFTEEDITDEIAALIFGGQDTTFTAMSWALYLIGLYPEVQRKLHKEIDSVFVDNKDQSLSTDDLRKLRYTECVLKECQRIYPIFPFNGKQLLKDCNLCGHKLKKGKVALISNYNLHRDPEVFPNPEKFDPDRFLPENSLKRSPFSYIPFSAGNRACIGRRLALMELKVVLFNVLRNFTVKSLDHRDKIRLSVDIVLHSVDPLKLKFTHRYIKMN